jgi:superfamily I DNA and RNA helicase
MLYRAKNVRNILYRINTRKTSWIDHILHRNSLQKHIIEEDIGGRIEIRGR